MIVWREALEAILIVGLIRAFFLRQAKARSGTSGLDSVRWAMRGVWSGLGLSLLTGFALFGLQDLLPEDALAHFQTALLLIAALLMTQMVFWMNHHARTLKSDLEHSLSLAAERHQRSSIFLISLAAVAREGVETVIYLYGMGAENLARIGALQTAIALTGAIAFGVVCAAVTSKLLATGFRALSLKTVFRITGAWLLCSASSLLLAAIVRLESLETWPIALDTLWNSSWFARDQSAFGGFLRMVLGYRARPTAAELGVWLTYWTVCVFLLVRTRTPGFKLSASATT